MSGLVAHHFFVNSCGTFHEQRSLKVNKTKTQQSPLAQSKKNARNFYLILLMVQKSGVYQSRLVCYPHYLQGGKPLRISGTTKNSKVTFNYSKHPHIAPFPIRLTKWRINRINRCDIEKNTCVLQRFVKVLEETNKKNMDFCFKRCFFFQMQVVFGSLHETPKI